MIKSFRNYLLEGTKEYKAILGPLYDDPVIKQHLDWAREVLKKSNRIEWFSRIIKYINDIQQSDYDPSADNDPERKVLYTELQSDLGQSLTTLLTQVEGMLKPLAYTDITDEVFKKGNYNITDVYSSINNARLKFVKSKHLLKDDGKNPYMAFSNGYYWRMLSVGACSREGEAMGHCGNFTNQKPGDILVSLRKTVDSIPGYSEVFITVILDKNHYAKEVRGKFNSKPDPSLNKYVIELLKSDHVAGINNTPGEKSYGDQFIWDDLSPADKSLVKRANPDLKVFDFVGGENINITAA